MADYKLSYTASEINEKLGQIGQPVSWNDLTDKPFYTDIVQETLLPTTTLTFTLDTSTGTPMCAFMTPPTSEMVEMYSKEWGKAVVMWDGARYECEPKPVMGIKAIGNADAVLGTGDSGEPFAMLVDGEGLLFGSPIAFIVSIMDTMNGTQSATHSVGVSLCIDKIHPIDTKFINNILWENISNKPFETILAGTIIADEEIVAQPINTVNSLTVDWDNFIVGVNYNVIINDDVYTAQALQESNGSITIKGFGIQDNNNSDVFLLYSVYSGFFSETLTEGETYHVKIAFAEDYVKTLEAKYLDIVDYAPSKILVNDYLDFLQSPNSDVLDFYANVNGVHFIAGKKYSVSLNGSASEIVTATLDEGDNTAFATLNISTPDGTWFMWNQDGGIRIFSPYDTEQGCNVYIEELEVCEIKEKYLPDSLYTEIDQRIENYINEALGGEY